jgi:membrane protease YdiL (CAAX protease family)
MLQGRLKVELAELYRFVKRNGHEILVVCSATLFLMLARYHSLGANWKQFCFYYALLPLATILLVLRKNPLDFGLRLGNVRLWGFHLLVACPVVFLLVYLGTSTADVQRYYHASDFKPLGFVVESAIQVGAWEFIFRGFMLFGLKEKFKEGAILVQMIPFALLHLGKPEAETISCIVSGLYFGYVCYRTGSFWPAWLLHLFINYSTTFLAVY